MWARLRVRRPRLTRALQAYVARVATGKSLIVHIVAHARMPDGKVVMVMNNWLPVRCNGCVRSAAACMRAAARAAARRRAAHASARRAGLRGGARRAAAARSRVEASHGRAGRVGLARRRLPLRADAPRAALLRPQATSLALRCGSRRRRTALLRVRSVSLWRSAHGKRPARSL